jgi:ArsR family transcriptional regulator
MRLSAKQAVDVLRAAGEPTRLRILALLERENWRCSELCRVLDQSQPRVSRHLKLLAEAGLVERFPDGAWVFYRLTGAGRAHEVVGEVLCRINPDDPALARDRRKLDDVQASAPRPQPPTSPRTPTTGTRSARSMSSDADVEAEIVRAAGHGPFRRLVDLGAGTGRMLNLLAPQADQAVGLDLSQQMLNIARRNATQAGLGHVELRHGDIFDTRLPDEAPTWWWSTRCCTIWATPRGRARGGADRGPRRAADHRRLRPAQARVPARTAPAPSAGLFRRRDGPLARRAGLPQVQLQSLPPVRADGLTVKIWAALRAPTALRSAA